MKLLARSVFFFLLCSAACATTVDDPLRPGWFFQPPANLGPMINSVYKETEPTLSADGLTLIFASDRLGVFPGRDLWQSTRTSIGGAWTLPAPLGSPVNTTANESAPSLSANGLTLYFSSHRSDDPNTHGANDVWKTTRTSATADWGVPTNLGSVVNSSYDDGDPDISPDGRTLHYGRFRSPEGAGNWDVWLATRATDNGPWQTSQNAGSVFNTPGYDSKPSLSRDGLALMYTSDPEAVSSDRQLDLWLSTRASHAGAWAAPFRLSAAVNTRDTEQDSVFLPTDRSIYFRSDRPGSYGDHDLWMSTAIPSIAYSRLRDPGIGARDYTAAGDELGFTTTVLGSTGGAEPFVGVAEQYERWLSMRSTHARTVFDTVDLINFVDAEFTIDVRNSSTSWEAEDFVSVTLSNGPQNISVLGLDTPDGLEAAEGPWRNYRVSIPDDWAQATLTVISSSNSTRGAEQFDFDNIAFFGTPIPEPSSLILFALSALLLFRRR